MKNRAWKSIALLVVAAVMGLWTQRAHAFAFTTELQYQVVPEGSGYRYNYSLAVSGFVPNFVGFEEVVGIKLPIFDADAVSDITSAVGWTGSLEVASPANWAYDPNTDPFANTYDAPASEFVDPSHVLNWVRQSGFIGGAEAQSEQFVISGFSFYSAYAPGDGPAVLAFASFIPVGETVTFSAVDPPLPSSPNSPFYMAPPTVVPEPATAAMGLMALAGLAAGLRRRRI